MKGWEALSSKAGTAWGYAITNPKSSIAGIGIGMAGLSMAGKFLSDPVGITEDAIAGGFVAASAVSRHPWETAAAVAGTAAVGAGLYGATKIPMGSYGTAGKAIGTLGAKAASSFSGIPLPGEKWKSPGPRTGNKMTGPLHAYGQMWDNSSWKKGVGVAAGLGVAFGAARATVEMGGRPVYDSAMARSEEGSAYEGGNDSFGKRSSRVLTMGHSTQNLVQGMHNKR
jgi:hypothetical protein